MQQKQHTKTKILTTWPLQTKFANPDIDGHFSLDKGSLITSSFPGCMPYFFFLSYALARNSGIMLNKSSESRHLSFVLNLSRKAFRLSWCHMIIVAALYQSEKVPLSSYIVESCFRTECLIFFFFLHDVLPLWKWDKSIWWSYIILPTYHWILFAKILFRIFPSMFMKDIGL